MKKTIQFISIAMIAGLAITGCTNGTPNNDGKTSQSATQTADKSQATKVLNDYYNAMVQNAETASTNSTQIETVMKEVLGDATYERIASSTDTFDSLSSLTEDEQKELATRIQELNPLASYYDFSGMSDNDRTYLNLLLIASSSLISTGDSTTDYKIEITIPEDKIKVKENKATISFSDIGFTVNGNKSDQNTDPLNVDTIYLTSVKGEWKIDGKQTFESIKQQYNDSLNAPDVSDGGGASDGSE